MPRDKLSQRVIQLLGPIFMDYSFPVACVFAQLGERNPFLPGQLW